MATKPAEAFTMELQPFDAATAASERAKWLLSSPSPPAPWRQVYTSVRESVLPGSKSGQQPRRSKLLVFLEGLFPILKWGRNYKATKFKNDLLAGLTLASLCIPQSIGYANLAKLDPQYGLLVSTKLRPRLFVSDLHPSHPFHLQGRRYKKFFWLPAVAPLFSVVLSTFIVYLTKADKHGVKIVKHLKGGLNPISVHQLDFGAQHVGEAAKIGLICALIALTEAIAVGRSFASIKGYHLDGNKEMVAMGCMNIVGSFTSCYTATGSFSRTAVNFSAGCETVVSNIVMSITVLISLLLFTKLLYYTPLAILASIILSALPGLIDINGAYNIWKVDKLDFLVSLGAFFGVLFGSIEIGLLIAVGISFGKIILLSIKPSTEELGRLPGTDIFCSINQFPVATKIPGIIIIQINSGTLCFANANFIRERILKWLSDENEIKENKAGVRVMILDMTNVMNIDTTGIHAMEELHKKLISRGIENALQ
ncbi:low affinity sulfate transporter 3-like [Salvia hispanica]|uniref:low affinity sulfate transporter 3-like n=1 Tax=Salvia hispanica TaxID=49212 RepID=UPI0020096BD2|nr:low affinity sulfate transporter 3-like [Salvia hispanica]